ncbi:MAG: DUF3667 domain-containing protein [Muribaculaceae bacterium]|nr:DUF3667 domain-containing protein [Muribaculaceae bacterium]
MTLKERYKRFKAWQLAPFDWSFDESDRHHCENCGNDFSGNYCPHCSQKVGLNKITWKRVFQSTAEVWGMHNRSFLYSLWQLIWRPGHLISDYINGRLQVSFPPVKMLVIMGVISVLIDNLFGVVEVKKVVGDSSLVNQFFAWTKDSPGWGWLIMTCFFIIPTWCLFRYAPRNTKHTLPQDFFITVFMAIQVLIVDDLADFFGDFFYILLPLCYFYAYRQLFGYGFWGNFWRVVITLVSGFLLATLAMTITELLTTTPKSYTDEFKAIIELLFCSVVPILVGMYISKKTYNRRKKKETQSLEISVNDQTENNNQIENSNQTENKA